MVPQAQARPLGWVFNPSVIMYNLNHVEGIQNFLSLRWDHHQGISCQNASPVYNPILFGETVELLVQPLRTCCVEMICRCCLRGWGFCAPFQCGLGGPSFFGWKKVGLVEFHLLFGEYFTITGCKCNHRHGLGLSHKSTFAIAGTCQNLRGALLTFHPGTDHQI